MSLLHIFNPEHDYALACWNRNYTAPDSVRRIAAHLQMLPLMWARDDDYILMADDVIIRVKDRKRVAPSTPFSAVIPWGWNPALCLRLTKLGIEARLLPSPEYMENLRRLSHRRISIECNRFLSSPAVPEEFRSVEEAMAFYHSHPGCYLKMPWSSSGRGILATGELSASQVSEWISGCIRKQGSVMAEQGVARIIDFATLWDVSGDFVHFDGYSVSLSDGRGKYDGNLYGAQEQLREYIESKVAWQGKDVEDGQRAFIQDRIAPYYKGKLGIDMMAGSDGQIYPCVEINLRRTMGHVAIDYYERIREDGDDNNSWKRQCRVSSLQSIEEYLR